MASVARAAVPIGLAAIVAGEIAGTYYLGMRGVDTFDMAIVADGGYRIWSGQVPYRDFHIPMGPIVFYLQAAFCGLLGGFSWEAGVLHAAVVGAFATLVIYGIVRAYLSPVGALGFAAFGALTFYMPLAVAWHDQTAYFGTLLALGVFALADRASWGGVTRWRCLLAGVQGVLLTLAIFSKQNIGMVSLLLLMPLWLLPSPPRSPSWAGRIVPAATVLLSCVLSALALAAWWRKPGRSSKT